MAEQKIGKVILVGAGCGKDLITVRGLRALKGADVILYDDLIDEDLLLFAKDTCRRIYVGKRFQKHSRKQEEIEKLLIRYAREGRQVIRLKGGDSFVFGRGGEEILALQKAGIPYEVIPGVTSSVAVPEELGIPVTHRKTARSFTVITGHTADGTGENYQALASLDGTLVFLMGLHAAGNIAAGLMEHGKSPKTPAAVLSRGFTDEEKRWDCTLETLGEIAVKAASPAILVVGDVAAMHLEGTPRGPLEHISVAVTGSAHFIHSMSEELERYGADQISCPCLLIRAHPERIPKETGSFSWIVFTSANGVRIFFEEFIRRGSDLRSLAGQKFAVIGKGTAASLAGYGIQADFVPGQFISDVFGRELAEKIRQSGNAKEKVLILRAENGSPLLTKELDRAGVPFQDVKIYETGTGQKKDSETAEKLKNSDYITFSSAAGVRAFFSEYTFPEHAVPVCIGPSTAAELKKHTETAFLMPDEYTVRGMVGEIIRDRQRKKTS